ncbi:MAG: glycoside hydrolase family 9 protein, partial [Cyclobacteriaceae bacterium]|nr:glycoside hydrolase family 9 protein [Cyclobacteriaceae bacterium]
AGVRRMFKGEDWTKSNRISLWIYPDCPGFYINWLELRVYNDGVENLPALFGQEGETSLLLRNKEWNHVVWEIGNVARDKVTSLEISYYLSGNEPEASDTATYYIDHLELQKVDPDYIEGWGVWPGRISYSHTGYQSGASKTAIASGLDAREFQLVDQETGETVLSKPVQTVETHLGSYQVMDFSEVRKTGTYILKAGTQLTQPFRIDPNVWRETILKALNFFYVERCGTTISGVHGNCHRDWICVHGDKKIDINGGWHDAGDLTQGLGNTAEAAYAMFSLAERLHIRNEDMDLYKQLLEEARWGLNWIMKTSFRNGYRNGGSISSRRTNGIIGDFDDLISTARNTPLDHFVASAVEALAFRVLKDDDPRLAAYTLKMAEEDWGYAVEGMAATKAQPNKSIFRGTFDSDNVEHEVVSLGIRASVDLWKATGNQQYREKAAEWAKVIVNSQQQRKPDWDIPITGFFYTSPAKEHILHYCHRGREQAPILALTALCEAFPDHPDWMNWYSSIALHSEYLKTVARYTEPFGVFPASIYSDQEYLLAPDSRRESFRKQVLNGIPLGKGHYLRLFPVWMDYRGHFGTILPQAKALASAGHLRGDLASAQLAQHQLEWVIGRNPFSQSNMWGEGYDFPPLYTPLSGDMVGGLPVGIQTRGDHDVPYWPVQNSWTYKEIWGYPVTSWISLMRDLAGPALVEGFAKSEIEFNETTFDQTILVNPELNTEKYRILLPQGTYQVRCGEIETTRTFLPGASYQLDLRIANALDFEVTQTTSAKGEVTIELNAWGTGIHQFNVRTNNLSLRQIKQQLILKQGMKGTLKWSGHISLQDMPWIAVIVPDEDLSQRKEVNGVALEK